MNCNLATLVAKRIDGNNRGSARIIQSSDGRYILQWHEYSAVMQIELTGRPDGIRPESFESDLERLRGRLHDSETARILPQEWMELDREFAQYQQRRKLVMTVAAEPLRSGNSATAAQLYRLAASDARHCLEIIDFAHRSHPSGQLSTAKPELLPAILTQLCIANAQLSVIAHDLDGAVSCIRTGIDEVSKRLTLVDESAPEVNECVRDLRNVEQTIMEGTDTSQVHSSPLVATEH